MSLEEEKKLQERFKQVEDKCTRIHLHGERLTPDVFYNLHRCIRTGHAQIKREQPFLTRMDLYIKDIAKHFKKQ